jgi:probable F420-dependent oxidoreductase
MKFGVVPFCRQGFITDPLWVKAFIATLERIGAESVWAVEHVVVAQTIESAYPSDSGKIPLRSDTVIPDPLEWLTFAAASSEALWLATGVIVMPLQNPVVLAKRVATLDALSRGRLLLGVGLGWQREEYDAVGVDFSERPERLEEGIGIMRALWRPGVATYHGRFNSFENILAEPKPFRTNGVPFVMGGSSEKAARRAGRLADGYFPHAISPEDLASRLRDMREAASDAGRDPDRIEITVAPSTWRAGCSLDLGVARAYADLGVSRLIVRAHEAASGQIPDIERYLLRYRDDVVDRL